MSHRLISAVPEGRQFTKINTHYVFVNSSSCVQGYYDIYRHRGVYIGVAIPGLPWTVRVTLDSTVEARHDMDYLLDNCSSKFYHDIVNCIF